MPSAYIIQNFVSSVLYFIQPQNVESPNIISVLSVTDKKCLSSSWFLRDELKISQTTSFCALFPRFIIIWPSGQNSISISTTNPA